MRDIEFEFGVARVGGCEDAVDFVGVFAERAHVVVVPEGHAEVGGALAQFGHELAEFLLVVGSDGAIFGAIVGDLQVEAAGVVDEFGVSGVLGKFVGGGTVDGEAAAGECDEG